MSIENTGSPLPHLIIVGMIRVAGKNFALLTGFNPAMDWGVEPRNWHGRSGCPARVVLDELSVLGSCKLRRENRLILSLLNHRSLSQQIAAGNRKAGNPKIKELRRFG